MRNGIVIRGKEYQIVRGRTCINCDLFNLCKKFNYCPCSIMKEWDDKHFELKTK